MIQPPHSLKNSINRLSRQYNIHFTFNQQAQVLNLLRFIYARYHINFKKFITGDKITGIINNNVLLPQQKGEKILNELRRLANPLITGTELQIKQLTSKIYNVTGIKIKMPEYLEGDCMAMDVPGSTYKEASARLHELSTKCNAEFTKLMNFLE